MKKEELAVQEFLQSKGISVVRITENRKSGKKTPDFLLGSDSILEVKSRSDSKFIELLESSKPGEKALPIGYRNKISGIIEDGVEQLTDYDEEPNKFRIIWFYLDEGFLFSDLVATQIFSTIYGFVDLEGYTRSGTHFSKGCFYFTYNDFFRFTNLDALVIHRSDEIALCLNEFSHHYQKFGKSQIYHIAKNNDWLIFDPPELEKERRCFSAVDCQSERSNQDAMFKYIAKRYNLRKVDAYDFRLINMPNS